jgi:hypothetical protein
MDSHGAETANSIPSTAALNPPPSTTEYPPSMSPSRDLPDDAASTSASSISNPALEVDLPSSTQDNSDADSAISGMRAQSSTQSATSSIYDFVEEHGRTYHKYKEGKYVLPNDAEEQNRLDMQHQMILRLLEGRIHLAPIKNVRNVLDIGTGTGIWAIEFAK